VTRLVNSERKKDLVKKIIENNIIQDEYLNKKYGESLSIIAKHYKTDIKSLVIDYLDNLSNYNEIIKNKDLKINVLSELNDFCRELDGQEVFNDNSETDFAKYLRTLHSKREKIGKKDLHYALTTFFDSFKMSQDEFNNLS
jgi:hypothetical protein